MEKALVGLLHSSNEALRRSAAHGLVAGGRLAALAPALLADQQVVAALPGLAADLGGRESMRFVGAVLRRARGTPAIGQLCGMLSDPATRPAAAAALATARDPAAAPALIAALATPPRGEVIDALKALADPRAVEPLLECLRTGQPDERQRAVVALRSFPSRRVVQGLLPLMEEQGDTEVRQHALAALCSMGSLLGAHRPQVLAAVKREVLRGGGGTNEFTWVVHWLGPDAGPVAAELLQQAKDAELRRGLLWRLSESAGPGQVPVLLGQVAETEGYGRADLALALGHTRDRRVVRALIDLLADPEWEVQQAAALALGEVGDRRAIRPLLAVMERPSAENRAAAAEALGKLGARQAIPYLRESLEKGILPPDSSPDEACSMLVDEPAAAARALGRLCDEGSVPLLLRALRDGAVFDNDTVPAAAAEALGSFDRPDVRRALLAALARHPDEMQLAGLAMSLGRLRERRAVPDLIEALYDPMLEEEARRALTAIAGRDLGRESEPWEAWWKGQAQ